MKWKVVARAQAESDVLEAADWYDTQQAGLGDEFVEEVRPCSTRSQLILFNTASVTQPKTFGGATLNDFHTVLSTKSSKRSSLLSLAV